jgi:hypothetical protein
MSLFSREKKVPSGLGRWSEMLPWAADCSQAIVLLQKKEYPDWPKSLPEDKEKTEMISEFTSLFQFLGGFSLEFKEGIYTEPKFDRAIQYLKDAIDEAGFIQKKYQQYQRLTSKIINEGSEILDHLKALRKLLF